MDYGALFMRKLYWNRVNILKIASTLLAQIKLKLWGVTFGKKLHVIGRIIVFRNPESVIQIGDYCIFNSSSKLNFRGINHPCILQTGTKHARITIGDHVEMSGCSIVCNDSVIIGNNVLFGANCQIGDRDGHQDRYASKSAPIIIEDGVWLGMNVTVLKGVTIGKDTIIGANSLVTKDIPANCIAAGSPCKVIKHIDSNKR